MKRSQGFKASLAFRYLGRGSAACLDLSPQALPYLHEESPAETAHLLFRPLRRVHGVGGQAELLAHPSLVVHGLRLQAVIFWNVAMDKMGSTAKSRPGDLTVPCLLPVLHSQQALAQERKALSKLFISPGKSPAMSLNLSVQSTHAQKGS